MAKFSLAQALFTPRTIALIGASADTRKITSRPQRFLKNHGFEGRVLPVNPNRKSIFGRICYPDIGSAPGPVDHAFIMLPTNAVIEAVRECGAAGVGCVTVLAGGFADSGNAGRRRQDKLLAAARDGGVRLVGPNSIGVINASAGATLSVNAVFEMPRLAAGGLGVISHSGSLLGALVSRGQARNLRFSKLISIGNEADLTVGEVGDLLVDDPATKSILLFLETIRSPDAIAAMARRANAAGKPVLAYKLGRTKAGREVALSHTGALAGADAAVDAFLAHHGIARVGMFETLIEAAPLFAGRRRASGRARGRAESGRVAVITTTGGGGAMVVDCLGTRGIEAVVPSGARKRLKAHGIPAGSTRLLDLTLAGTNAAIVGEVMDAVMDSRGIDAVVMVVGSSAQFHPDLAVAPLARWANSAKPLAVQLVPDAGESAGILADAGIAAFRTPESCADGIAAYLGRRPPSRIPRRGGQDLAAAAGILARSAGPVLDESRAQSVFAALGIATAKSRLISGPDEAVTAVLDVGFPAAVKVVSRQIAHKSDGGGVVLGITSGVELGEACRRVLANAEEAHPDAEIEGLLVQRMESGISEVLVGYRLDPMVGPIVTVGVGGILAEIHRDIAVRLAPVTSARAQAMIDQVPGLALVRGVRSQPAGDRAALAAVIVALSNLARLDGTTVSEAEINPLIVKPAGEGVVAVDGLIVLEAREAG
jgi:acyl-CoA synthetase (NDP forming)